MAMHNPPHPGGIVRRQCLDTLDLSVTEAAKGLGVTRQALSDLINGKAGISIDMAIRLSKAFGSNPETWLGLQMAYDLWRARERISVPAQAQSPDDDLKVYAVNVVKTPPFEKQFTGYGIYLGHGTVITAAHVVGHWPAFTNPRVLVAGQDLPAKVIKEGSFETVDLALLSVNEEHLPISLRLRRNPLCKEPPKAGEDVIVVLSYGTVRSRIIFPQLLPPKYRTSFNTFINDVWIAGGSGSGVFHAERKCLLGILSSKIWNYNYRMENGRMVRDLARNTMDIARHFVPASEIAEFIPPEYRF